MAPTWEEHYTYQPAILRRYSRGRRAHPGAGIAHDGDEAVEEHHGHGEDEEQQQDDANDGIMAVVEQVQVCAPQHDGEQRHKGMQDIAELLQSTHTDRISHARVGALELQLSMTVLVGLCS